MKAFEQVGLDDPFPHIGAGYLAKVAMWAIIGGFWAFGLERESDKPWLAVYHGATAPIVLAFLAHIYVPSP